MAEEGFRCKLTAILSADVEGYSRLMGDDEEATVRTLTAYREVLYTLIQQHNGKMLDSPLEPAFVGKMAYPLSMSPPKSLDPI